MFILLVFHLLTVSIRYTNSKLSYTSDTSLGVHFPYAEAEFMNIQFLVEVLGFLLRVPRLEFSVWIS
jgi:hypothetical protein